MRKLPEGERQRRRRATRRAYNQRNRPKVLAAKREKQRAWRVAHPEEAQAALAAWRAANPTKTAEYHRRRRANKHGVQTEYYTAEDIIAMWGSDCHICKEPIDLNAPRKTGVPGWKRGLHLDHVIPISRGGDDLMVNVKPAHGLCNLSKHRKIVED